MRRRKRQLTLGNTQRPVLRREDLPRVQAHELAPAIAEQALDTDTPSQVVAIGVDQEDRVMVYR